MSEPDREFAMTLTFTTDIVFYFKMQCLFCTCLVGSKFYSIHASGQSGHAPPNEDITPLFLSTRFPINSNLSVDLACSSLSDRLGCCQFSSPEILETSCSGLTYLSQRRTFLRKLSCKDLDAHDDFVYRWRFWSNIL